MSYFVNSSSHSWSMEKSFTKKDGEKSDFLALEV